jgi:PIN domain nuclease of toxin-antitoxin system
MDADFVVDAQALLWFITNDPKLGVEAKKILSNPKSRLVLPAIALAEACWVVERGRFKGLTTDDVLKTVRRDKRIRVAALTTAIIARTVALAGISEMHDRQIVATVLRIIDLKRSAVLLTADAEITRAALVPVMW